VWEKKAGIDGDAACLDRGLNPASSLRSFQHTPANTTTPIGKMTKATF
jgi:hypothetical protein